MSGEKSLSSSADRQTNSFLDKRPRTALESVDDRSWQQVEPHPSDQRSSESTPHPLRPRSSEPTSSPVRGDNTSRAETLRRLIIDELESIAREVDSINHLLGELNEFAADSGPLATAGAYADRSLQVWRELFLATEDSSVDNEWCVASRD
mmetsp:Transcript_6411/g.19446  ORF Transcript_6411/g.19446 Transcript_6411/m.19446 type:complete len:150 (-) Transcript_6411:752-1201(-)